MLSIRSTLGTGLAIALCATAGVGCDAGDTRRLSPVSVALSESVPPIYDDGELTIYEAKTALELPIIAPSEAALGQLWAEPSDPFERHPWITSDDVEVQVNWTLSNLDESEHRVWVMIDPHNEFGRYEPALVVTDDEATRDFSGIDMLFSLPGVSAAPGAADPRVTGTFTFDDMAELALDFATVFKILRDAVPADPEDEDPRGTLLNYAFNVRNRSYNSPLLAPYAPDVVPGLTGFDFGVRSDEPVNVALEIVVELRDRHGDRVAERGQAARLLDPSDTVISGGGP